MPVTPPSPAKKARRWGTKPACFAPDLQHYRGITVPTVAKGSNKGRGKGKGETERVRESQKPRPAHGGLGRTQATAVINRVRQPVCVLGSYIMSDLLDVVSLNYVIANPRTPLDPPTHTPHH